MKPMTVLLIGFAAVGLTVAAALMAQTETVIKIKPPRTAVDLAFVVERDAEDKIVKIHRFILWSDGRVTFPNIPYYASLLLNCRDCPKVPNPCPADINGDGKVGVPDMLILQAAWGTDCP